MIIQTRKKLVINADCFGIFQEYDLMNIIINNNGAPPTLPNPTMISNRDRDGRGVSYQGTIDITTNRQQYKGCRAVVGAMPVVAVAAAAMATQQST